MISFIILFWSQFQEIDICAIWGLPKNYDQKINNTDKTFYREFFLQMNSQSWTWNNTRNISIFWAELPEWLKNVSRALQSSSATNVDKMYWDCPSAQMTFIVRRNTYLRLS